MSWILYTSFLASGTMKTHWFPEIIRPAFFGPYYFLGGVNVALGGGGTLGSHEKKTVGNLT